MKIKRLNKENGTKEVIDRIEEVMFIVDIISNYNEISRNKVLIALSRGEEFQTEESIYKQI